MMKYKLIYIVLATGLYFLLWRSLTPVEIIGVHKLGTTSAVVIVKNFPLTRSGSISWWKRRQFQLQQKWPFLNSSNTQSIFFFQTNYQENSGTDEDSDLLCFEERVDKENCISKQNRPLVVIYYPDGRILYKTENFFQRFLRHL